VQKYKTHTTSVKVAGLSRAYSFSLKFFVS